MTKRLNVGIVVDNEFNTDPRVLRLIKVLRESGYKINVLCYGYRGMKYKSIDGIAVRRIIIPRLIKNFLFLSINSVPLFNWLWSKEIERFIDLYQVDVLHVNDLYMSRPSHTAIYRTKKGVKLILDLHENFPAAIMTYNWTRGKIRKLLSQPQKWEKKELEYLSYADYIVVLSEWFKDTLRTKYNQLEDEKLVVFPNYLDLDEIRIFEKAGGEIDFKKFGTVFIYFGVVAERRGVFETVRAFRNIVNKGLNCQLLIIGPIDKADRLQFIRLIEMDSVKGKITYIPWIDVSFLPAYLEVSDIGLAPFHKNPQHDSGVSNKIFQYLYGELAVIASDCQAQKQLIEKYDCGLIFRNEKELEEAMDKLVMDPECRQRMGLNGKKAILDELNLESSKVGIQSLYSALVKQALK